jgi:hypothetical protein
MTERYLATTVGRLKGCAADVGGRSKSFGKHPRREWQWMTTKSVEG